jgi:hypothetical protein
MNEDKTKVFYHYIGPAEKNADGEWKPISR